MAGSEILCLGNKNSSLLQFRPGDNDSKNPSEHFREKKWVEKNEYNNILKTMLHNILIWNLRCDFNMSDLKLKLFLTDQF